MNDNMVLVSPEKERDSGGPAIDTHGALSEAADTTIHTGCTHDLEEEVAETMLVLPLYCLSQVNTESSMNTLISVDGVDSPSAVRTSSLDTRPTMPVTSEEDSIPGLPVHEAFTPIARYSGIVSMKLTAMNLQSWTSLTSRLDDNRRFMLEIFVREQSERLRVPVAGDFDYVLSREGETTSICASDGSTVYHSQATVELAAGSVAHDTAALPDTVIGRDAFALVTLTLCVTLWITLAFFAFVLAWVQRGLLIRITVATGMSANVMLTVRLA